MAEEKDTKRNTASSKWLVGCESSNLQYKQIGLLTHWLKNLLDHISLVKKTYLNTFSLSETLKERLAKIANVCCDLVDGL